MTIRFSPEGPAFPAPLINSLMVGEVIFLCGAGVSTPQMPGFRDLVERTYKELGLEKSPSEQAAFQRGRFEEVLGSLGRRLADPLAVTRTVSNLLAVPRDPTLDRHRTILRLSRDLDNKTSLVTTNFDTLFERALGEESAKDISFAGQDLPIPGSHSFSGIIHIHGRLADLDLGLNATPMVLTSADYGDAYMRSGWASRFLFDLARCKSIVLLGYSAEDAPVRYFLNMLEADRGRFSDLKLVYAFDAYKGHPEETVESWETLAVTPIPYLKVEPESGESDHSLLWRGLSTLADLVDSPDLWRKKRIRSIVAGPEGDLDDDTRKELGWLLPGYRRDLWPVALAVITDPEWFEFFWKSQQLTEEVAPWVISTWVARRFQDEERLKRACEWQKRLGTDLTERIQRNLATADSLEEQWIRIWRLFCCAEPVENSEDRYRTANRWLKKRPVLDRDLRDAVILLSPRLHFDRKLPLFDKDPSVGKPSKIGDFVHPRMAIRDEGRAYELIEHLCDLSEHAWRVVDLANSQLQSSLELQAELSLISEGFDYNDLGVPSIEPHDQNRHHQGVNLLVRLLAKTVPRIAALDRNRTRTLVFHWKAMPGRIGLRLCLHAMRDPGLFSSDEAMKFLLSMKDEDFCRVRREIPLVIRDRAREASPSTVAQVEDKIRDSANAYYERFEIALGEGDWRSHARDEAVWLRFTMLEEAGSLSKHGAAELSAIFERHDHLNRNAEDRDFFSSYVFGARFVKGDATAIHKSADDERLAVAVELSRSPSPELREGWATYCRTDPQGAFDSLVNGERTEENSVLWNQLLQSLSYGDEENRGMRETLAENALTHLAEFENELLMPMVAGLSDLILFATRLRPSALESWIERLIEVVRISPEERFSNSLLTVDKAINSASGKMAQALLIQIEARRKQDGNASADQLANLNKVIRLGGQAGSLGRIILAADLPYLMWVDRDLLIKEFSSWLRATDEEGVALRSAMLGSGSISPNVTLAFKEEILKGASECVSDNCEEAIAACILRPALAEFDEEDSTQWGLQAADVAQVLRQRSLKIRVAMLSVLERWLTDEGDNLQESWKRIFRPCFQAIWPKEHRFLDVSLTHGMIALAIATGDEFPSTLEMLNPFVVPFEGDLGILAASRIEDTAERFPSETLQLLWKVCGPGSSGSRYGIARIIATLVGAKPELEIDRRVQWLRRQAS